MIARNVEARIIKLEARRQRPNEMLLIWRKPDQPVKEAIVGADFGPGDRVICVEWFGDEPFPSPRWHGKRFEKGLPPEQSDYIHRSMNRIVNGESTGDPNFVRPAFQSNRIVEMSDNDLLYCIFGVAT